MIGSILREFLFTEKGEDPGSLLAIHLPSLVAMQHQRNSRTFARVVYVRMFGYVIPLAK